MRSFPRIVLLGLVIVATPAALPSAAPAETLAALDRRATELRHLDLPYEFHPPSSKGEWLQRAAYLREHILASTGLLPAPPRGPLNAHVFGRVDHGTYTVEKVQFESLPGLYVTGNLYRPKDNSTGQNADGKYPAVLNTHGHWNWGRLENAVDAAHPVRAFNFARLGFVTFSYDMIGYGDAMAIDHTTGIGGPREDLWGLSLMGLQLWNSMRAVDFLQSLPDVDPDRIGVTGESGGGTQTFMLAAVDDRIKAAAPVNMVSAHMQGGCLCENAPNLRVDTFNVEIAALAAPHPQLIISATKDWTKDTLKKEFPDVRGVYRVLGVEENVHAVQMDAVHNNNRESREAAYGFFAHAFQDRPDAKPITESKAYPPVLSELMVYYAMARPKNEMDAKHVPPAWVAMARRQLDDARPRTEARLQDYRRTFGAALTHSLSAEVPTVSDVTVVPSTTPKGQGASPVKEETFFLSRRNKGDRVPVTLWMPKTDATKTAEMSFVLVVEPAAAAGSSPHPQRSPLVEALLAAGHPVLGVALFAGRTKSSQVRFFSTYNRTDAALRVQDVLTAVSYLRGRSDIRRLSVVGVGKAGLSALLSRAFAPKVDALAVDVDGFSSDEDDAYLADLPIPGVRRAGGLVTAAIADTDAPLFLHDTGKKFNTAVVADGFRAAGGPAKLKVSATKTPDAALVAWLDSLDR